MRARAPVWRFDWLKFKLWTTGLPACSTPLRCTAMRVRIGGAIGLAAVMMVAACGGEDQPSTLPDATSTTATVPTTESATPTPTGDPTAQLEAEIREFLAQYARVINDSWISPDALAQRRAMFADSCVTCLAGYRLAERAQADGLRFEGGMASLRDLHVDRVNRDIVTVSAFTDSEAGRLIDMANKVVQEFDAAENVQIVYQLRTDGSGSWVILSGEVLG